MKRRHALGSPPGRFITPWQKRRILERDGWACRACHRSLEYADATIDHIIPWKHGGRTEDDNLQTLCGLHNKLKGNMSQAEFQAFLEGPVNEGV